MNIASQEITESEAERAFMLICEHLVPPLGVLFIGMRADGLTEAQAIELLKSYLPKS